MKHKKFALLIAVLVLMITAFVSESSAVTITATPTSVYAVVGEDSPTAILTGTAAHNGTLTYVKTSGPAWAELNGNIITFTPDSGVADGSYTATLSVTETYTNDSSGTAQDTADATVTVTVYSVKPNSLTASNSSVAVTAGTTTATATIIGTASNGGVIAYTLASAPTWVTLSGNILTFAPGAEVSAGTYPVTVRATETYTLADGVERTTTTVTTINAEVAAYTVSVGSVTSEDEQNTGTESTKTSEAAVAVSTKTVTKVVTTTTTDTKTVTVQGFADAAVAAAKIVTTVSREEVTQTITQAIENLTVSTTTAATAAANSVIDAVTSTTTASEAAAQILMAVKATYTSSTPAQEDSSAEKAKHSMVTSLLKGKTEATDTGDTVNTSFLNSKARSGETSAETLLRILDETIATAERVLTASNPTTSAKLQSMFTATTTSLTTTTTVTVVDPTVLQNASVTQEDGSESDEAPAFEDVMAQLAQQAQQNVADTTEGTDERTNAETTLSEIQQEVPVVVAAPVALSDDAVPSIVLINLPTIKPNMYGKKIKFRSLKQKKGSKFQSAAFTAAAIDANEDGTGTFLNSIGQEVDTVPGENEWGTPEGETEEQLIIPEQVTVAVLMNPGVVYTPIVTTPAEELNDIEGVSTTAESKDVSVDITTVEAVTVEVPVYDTTTYSTSFDEELEAYFTEQGYDVHVGEFIIAGESGVYSVNAAVDTSMLVATNRAVVQTLPMIAPKGNTASDMAGYVMKVRLEIPKDTTTDTISSADTVLAFWPNALTNEGIVATHGSADFLDETGKGILTADMVRQIAKGELGTAIDEYTQGYTGYIVMSLAKLSDDAEPYRPVITVKRKAVSSSSSGVAIDEANFPDAVFRAYVSSNFDTDSDDYLSEEEISNTTDINVNNATNINVRPYGIRSLKGIEHFTALKYLDCSYNYILSLDLSGNTSLQELCCWAQYPNDYDGSGQHVMGMISLDVSGCTALRRLECWNNQLTELDVSGCTALRSLNCQDNALTDLDVSTFTNLAVLNCEFNALTSLDLSNNSSLWFLSCNGNPIGTLDVSGLAELGYLECAQCGLTSLNVSNNPYLYHLTCGSDHLTELNLSNNPRLEFFVCYSSDITALDFSSNPYLRVCNLYDNICITSLDFSSNKQLRQLNLDHCTGLVSLNCANAQLTALDLYYSNYVPALTELNCSNQAIAIDAITTNASADWPYKFDVERAAKSFDIDSIFAQVSANATSIGYNNLIVKDEAGNEVSVKHNSYATAGSIVTFYFSAKPKTMSYTYDTGYSGSGGSMDVVITFGAASDSGSSDIEINSSNFPDPAFLNYITTYLDTNGDSSLSESELSAVPRLNLRGLGISDLTGIEHFSSLESLDCSNNSLLSLDISQNTSLLELYCDNNRLTSLDVSHNTLLQVLSCTANFLTALDLTSNTQLQSLTCTSNDIGAIDLSSNTQLQVLSIGSNDIQAIDLSSNSQIQVLEVFGNRLSSLDVSGLSNLFWLNCINNSLARLELSANSGLTTEDSAAFLFGQEVSVKSADETEISAWPYSIAFTDIDSGFSASEIGRVSSVDAKNFAGYAVNCSVDAAGGKVYFAQKPDSMTYYYDTGAGWYMDVAVSFAESAVAIDEKHFPDPVFREHVSSSYDTDSDGYLSDMEIAAVENISVMSMGISSLKGVEYFTALTSLYCDFNQLTELDISKNTALIDLGCYNNQLTELDVSKNINLTGLRVQDNRLTALDVSKNTALIGLDCSNNQLKSLDVSKNTALTTLWCQNTQLTELDVTRHTALTELNCGDNQLTELDVSKNTVLTALYCGGNPLNELDVSQNTALTGLQCYNNQLTTLDLRNNPDLIYIWCAGNQLTELDVSNMPNLESLLCAGNQINALDVSKNAKLTHLECGGNQLRELDVSKNVSLDVLACGGNQLTKLDVSKNTILTMLACDGNQLTELDVSKNTALTHLECQGNQLMGLDVSKNTALTWFNCGGNQLTELDVSKNVSLDVLDCGGNQLTELDVSKNTALTDLGCVDCQLTALDLRNNTALTKLGCAVNLFTELDLSKNTALIELDCKYGRLTALDVSGCTSLDTLACESQVVSISSPDITGDSSYPYSLSFSALNASLDISRVYSLDVADYYGSSVAYTADTSAGKWLFTAKPKTITYNYYTGHSGSYMDVTATLAGDPDTAPSISASTLPSALAGTFYSADISASGTAPITFTAEDLPSWLTIGSSTGTLSGTPPAVGTYTFTVTATNSAGSDTKNFTITVYAGSSRTAITEANFPDSAFRSYISENYDSDGDGYISGSDIENITQLELSRLGITDLTGIEYFTSLMRLDCSNNVLTALDVTSLSRLEYLYCYDNQLTELDVNSNPQLRGLYCYNNLLIELDVSSNPQLRYLDCRDNQLASLDVSQNTDLIELHCQNYLYPNATYLVDRTNNHITELDVSHNEKLTRLFCGWNQITVLDVSKNTNLTGLHTDGNPLKTLDVSHNEKLTELYCGSNQLSSLDVSKNTALISLECWVNELTTLDVSNNTALKKFECYDNQLTALDVSNNTDLTWLDCGYNRLTALDVSNNTDLTWLECGGNRLTALDVSNNTALEHLDCWGNQLSTLDVTNNPALEGLYCGRNNLTALNLSNNPALIELLCNYSHLTALDVSNNTALEFLDFGSNDVTALDVSNNTALKQLVFGENSLTALDVSNNTALEYLDYSNNQIAAMDLRNNVSLDSIACFSQNLTLPKPNPTGRADLPYSISLSTLKSALGLNIDIPTFTANVLSLDITDSTGSRINHSTDISAGTVYFASRPDTTSYIYNTGYSGSGRPMDVTVTFETIKVLLSPSSQTITQGDSITPIVISSVNASGDVVYTVDSLPSELTLSADTITGSISTVGTYTFTVNATDAEGETASATAAITVNSPYAAPSGISGISITTPSAKSITLSADGGTFSATLSASGTPYGSIVWTASPTQGLTADITGSDSTATLSGTAQPNTSSQDITGSITITAHDDTGTNYSDTLTVIVSSLILSEDLTSRDISQDISIDLTITGIAFTPDTLTLSPDGGQVNITASVQGTPSGDVTWTVSPENFSVSPQTGNSTAITGNVQANTSSADITHTVRVTAADRVHIVSADFTVIVAGRTSSSSGDHQGEESGDHSGGDNDNPDDDERPYYEKYSGDSWGDAYVMGSYSDFMDLVSRFLDGSESAGKYYSINADIDLSAVANFQSIGSESNPFRGHFNGNGKTITIPANVRGLFGLVDTDGIAIQNLSVRTGFSLYNRASGNNTPSDYSGGIVQELVSGTITDCTFTGTVTADGEDSAAGGIVGLLSGGTVQNCKVLSGSGIYASHSAGGIAGYVISGSISGCDSAAEVDADFSGGIAGYTESERRNITANTFTGAAHEVGNDELSLALLPVSQTVRAGETITNIYVSSDNAASWSFRVSGDYALGLISRDMTISGTIPAGLQPNTYTLIVNAVNSNGFTASALAAVTVTRRAAIDSDDITSGDITSDDITSGDNRPGDNPDSPGTQNNSVHYVFEIPSGVRDRITSRFIGETIYQFTDDEIISGTWELDAADSRAIADMYENIVLHLPILRPRNSGTYLLRLDLSGAGAGKNIKLYGITSGGGNVSAAALEDIDYILLDEDGNEVTQVPENGVVYAAMRLTANREHRGVITTPIELERGTIQPVAPEEIQETVLEKIAEAVNVSADQIKFITEENISEPQEPTQDMRTELESRQNQIIGKFNTITVDESGYYVLRVTLSDDLYEQIKDVSINQINVYALFDDGRTESADLRASIFNGIVSTWELLTLNGEKLEFGVKEFLMVGLLEAGKPFSVYLAKLIIMLLMGGCDTGLGISGLAVMALGAIFFIRCRKH